MTRRNFITCLLLFCIVLTGCGGKSVTQPNVIRDAESYTSDGLQAYNAADWYRAQWLFTRALTLYGGIDNQEGILQSHINLAEVAFSVRDYPSTRRHLDRAAEIARNPSLHHYQNRIKLLFAINALQQKKINQAESILHSLLPEFDGSTPLAVLDPIQMAAIANRTKVAFIQKQDEDLWTQRYENALKLSSIKKPDFEARLLRFQSNLLQNRGDYEEAESNLQRALSEYKTNLSRSGIAATLSELGYLYMAQGRWQDAQEALNRSLTVYRYLEDLTKVIQTTESLIIVEKELGNMESSRKLNQWLADTKDQEASRQINMKD